jgi:hypothetical protein
MRSTSHGVIYKQKQMHLHIKPVTLLLGPQLHQPGKLATVARLANPSNSDSWQQQYFTTACKLHTNPKPPGCHW